MRIYCFLSLSHSIISRKLQQIFGFFGPTAQLTFVRCPTAPVPRGFGFYLGVSQDLVVVRSQSFERVQQRLFAKGRRAVRLVHRFLRHALLSAVHQYFVTTCPKKNQKSIVRFSRPIGTVKHDIFGRWAHDVSSDNRARRDIWVEKWSEKSSIYCIVFKM